MASFFDTVLALNPVFFFRMDDTSGTVMTDSSGNNLHGTYFSTAVLGRPSPVVSDPSSFAVFGPAGKLVTPNGSPADVRGNFTWCVFGLHRPGDIAMLFCRNGQPGSGASNYIAYDG